MVKKKKPVAKKKAVVKKKKPVAKKSSGEKEKPVAKSSKFPRSIDAIEVLLYRIVEKKMWMEYHFENGTKRGFCNKYQ